MSTIYNLNKYRGHPLKSTPISKKYLLISKIGIISILLLLLTPISSKAHNNTLSDLAIFSSNCNERNALTNDSYDQLTASVTDDVSSLIPACAGAMTNSANLVDIDPNNYASVNITGLGCNGTFSVADQNTIYPVGSYAGFEISSAGLLQGGVAASVSISTYLNGTLQESHELINSLVGVNTSLIDGNGRVALGYITEYTWDEVRIEYQTLVGVLFSAQVYHAVVQEFCLPATSPACNEYTDLTNPENPIIINNANTGISGLACVGCSVNNAENVIDLDVNNAASIILAASVGTNGSLAVEDVLQTYAAGTFAGFEISNADLANVDLLNAISVSTYNDGVLQETSTSSNIIGANSNLLNGSGRHIAGFITSQVFDQIQINISNPLGVLNATLVYRLVIREFCAGTPDCTNQTYLSSPNFPVIIDNANTGIGGVACVGCSINNVENVIDNNIGNTASIVLLAGVLSSGSIAVEDVVSTYPAGMFAGFDIDNPALIDLSLLGGLTISTYLDGVLQETTVGTFLSLSLLSGTRQIVGFDTSLPFDEIQLTVSNLVSADLGTTLVYSAIVQSGDIDSDGIGDICDPVDSRAKTVDDYNNTPFNAPVLGDVSVNDLDNQTFSLNGTNGAMNTSHGTVTIDANGNYVFTPALDFEGETSFAYEACRNDAPTECETANVYIKVLPPVSPEGQPIIVNMDANVIEADQTTTGNVLSNDLDPDEGLLSVNVIISNQAVAGTDELGNAVPNAGTLTLEANGNYTFTPTPGFIGTIIYPYTACNDESTPDCGTSFLKLYILPNVGNSTYANDDALIVDTGMKVSGNVLTNDEDIEGNTQTISSYMFDSNGDMIRNTAGVMNGTTVIGGTNENGVYIPSIGILEMNSDGTYFFTAAVGFSGNAIVVYTVCDDNATDPTCDEATLIFTVLEANRDCGDAPIAYADAWHRAISDTDGDKVLDGSTNVWLGTNTDFDISANSSQAADADDYDDAMSFGGGAGEFPLSVTSSQSFDVTITLNGETNGDEVFYGMWIDWNDDGIYDSFYNGSGITNSPVDVTVSITVPEGVNGTDMVNVRLRADDDSFAEEDSSGSRTNGEVEDYQALVALPVELVSFKGEAKNCEVQLNWTSESEENFDRYEIEWSDDSQDWQTIDLVSGNGGINVQYYQYLHDEASRINYYRLKMVDTDGTYEYSNIIDVIAGCAAITELVLYPNPTEEIRGFISVKFLSTIETEEKVVILDMLGKTIIEMDISINDSWNTFDTNIQGLQKGVYVLRMENNQISKTFVIAD